MPKYPISITEAAEQDLSDIVEYIANDSPVAALKLADEIERSVLQLEDFPLIGAVPKNRRLARQGYRMLIVEGYLVFYVLPDDDTVEVRRILSSKREYRFLL
jgi:addiction module RelE/StbE family toxin